MKDQISFMVRNTVDGYILALKRNASDVVTPDNALARSIAKWEHIVRWLKRHTNDVVEDSGTVTCSLCILYYRRPGGGTHHETCLSCPVYKKTGEICCNGTPYIKYVCAVDNCYLELVVRHNDALKLAIQEVEFLKSLVTEPPNTESIESSEGVTVA